MNIEPILSASPAIQIHLVTALGALVAGVLIWLRPKGTRTHKFAGRVFMALMLLTAVSAIFIAEINRGHYSFIHIFIPITIIGIVQALWAIKNRNIKKHVLHVKNLFFFALLIPGILSVAIPGRRLFAVFFGA